MANFVKIPGYGYLNLDTVRTARFAVNAHGRPGMFIRYANGDPEDLPAPPGMEALLDGLSHTLLPQPPETPQ